MVWYPHGKLYVSGVSKLLNGAATGVHVVRSDTLIRPATLFCLPVKRKEDVAPMWLMSTDFVRLPCDVIVRDVRDERGWERWSAIAAVGAGHVPPEEKREMARLGAVFVGIAPVMQDVVRVGVQEQFVLTRFAHVPWLDDESFV